MRYKSKHSAKDVKRLRRMELEPSAVLSSVAPVLNYLSVPKTKDFTPTNFPRMMNSTSLTSRKVTQSLFGHFFRRVKRQGPESIADTSTSKWSMLITLPKPYLATFSPNSPRRLRLQKAPSSKWRSMRYCSGKIADKENQDWQLTIYLVPDFFLDSDWINRAYLTSYLTKRAAMEEIGIFDAKTRFSELVERVNKNRSTYYGHQPREACRRDRPYSKNPDLPYDAGRSLCSSRPALENRWAYDQGRNQSDHSGRAGSMPRCLIDASTTLAWFNESGRGNERTRPGWRCNNSFRVLI